MSNPDMRIPIQFALAYPERPALPIPRLDFAQLGQFTFLAPDLERFPCIRLAYEAIAQGGNLPCAMNAANEEAVHAFLREEIPFTTIAKAVEATMAVTPIVEVPTLEDIIATDREARIRVQEFLKR
jgi:1-deoxy-D-xylulose-5-phosphate reductoisomerase